jgi:hypothetical protein
MVKFSFARRLNYIFYQLGHRFERGFRGRGFGCFD